MGDTIVAEQVQAADSAVAVIDSSLIADRQGFFSGSPWAGGEGPTHFVGMGGEPVPYKLSNDVFITCTLMVCMFVACFVVSRSMHALGLQVKNFFRLRDRSEDFSLKSEGEVKDYLLVVLLEAFVLSLLFFSYTQHRFSDRLVLLSPYVMLLADLGIILAYFLYKYGVFCLFNWTFFSKETRQTWLRGYNLVTFGKALMLLFMAVIVLYFDLPIWVCIYIFVALVVVGEMLVLYKTKQIFFGSFFGLVPTILYFCALEILPLFFLWELLIKTNDFLVV